MTVSSLTDYFLLENYVYKLHVFFNPKKKTSTISSKWRNHNKVLGFIFAMKINPTKTDSIEYEMNTQMFTFKFGNSTNLTDITNSDR